MCNIVIDMLVVLNINLNLINECSCNFKITIFYEFENLLVFCFASRFGFNHQKKIIN